MPKKKFDLFARPAEGYYKVSTEDMKYLPGTPAPLKILVPVKIEGYKMKSCSNCEKEIPAYVNYCSWECNIELAKNNGGVAFTLNNLPIKCIKADGTMLEHEHGDHPDYKFPVEAEYIGTANEGNVRDIVEDYIYNEMHALIYSDSSMALTIYECNYAIWSLRTGKVIGSKYNKIGEWKLSDESLVKIKALK